MSYELNWICCPSGWFIGLQLPVWLEGSSVRIHHIPIPAFYSCRGVNRPVSQHHPSNHTQLPIFSPIAKLELPHCGFPSITLMFKWLNEQPTWTSWNRIRFEWALHFSSVIFFWGFNVAHLSYGFVKVIYAYYFKSCKNREKWGEWKLY